MQSQEQDPNAPGNNISEQQSYQWQGAARPPVQEQPYQYQESSPRGQSIEERPYDAGYPELEMDFRESDKIHSGPTKQQRPVGLFVIIAIIAGLLIGANLLGVIIAWLSWSLLSLLLVGVLVIIALNWRIVRYPMPLESFTVSEYPQLLVTNPFGSITVRRGESNVITIAATKYSSGIGANPENMHTYYDLRGNMLSIATQTHWSFFSFGIRKLDLEITVPESCAIQLSNGSGKLFVQGVNGSVRMKTGSGRIEAHDLRGQIGLKTGSGRIEATNIQGQVGFSTGSGSISILNINAQATLTTGSGRIEVSQAMLRGLSLFKTGSGSINFGGELDPYGNYEMKTGSGGVTFLLPPYAAFSLKAKTGSGGVLNEFGGNEVGNYPRAQLKIKTGSGRIHIQKGTFPFE